MRTRILALAALGLLLAAARARADGLNLVACILDEGGATGTSITCPVSLVANRDYVVDFFTEDPVTATLLDPQGAAVFSFPMEGAGFREYRAPASGTYTVRLDDQIGAGSRDSGVVYVDTDCRADAATACSIEPVGSRRGANRPLEEDDRYATTLVAGGVYRFGLTAPPGGRVTVVDLAGHWQATALIPRGRAGTVLRYRATRGGTYGVLVSSAARYTLAMRR